MLEPIPRFELGASSLPRKCSTPELYGHNLQYLSRCTAFFLRAKLMERVKGIEPSYSDWKSEVLPLNYTRKILLSAGYQLLMFVEPTFILLIGGSHLPLCRNRNTTNYLQSAAPLWWRGVDYSALRAVVPIQRSKHLSMFCRTYLLLSRRFSSTPFRGSRKVYKLPTICSSTMVEGGGFEPPKAEPSDLQSDPFGHSGTPPKIKRLILLENQALVNAQSAENRARIDIPTNCFAFEQNKGLSLDSPLILVPAPRIERGTY